MVETIVLIFAYGIVREGTDQTVLRSDPANRPFTGLKPGDGAAIGAPGRREDRREGRRRVDGTAGGIEKLHLVGRPAADLIVGEAADQAIGSGDFTGELLAGSEPSDGTTAAVPVAAEHCTQQLLTNRIGGDRGEATVGADLIAAKCARQTVGRRDVTGEGHIGAGEVASSQVKHAYRAGVGRRTVIPARRQNRMQVVHEKIALGLPRTVACGGTNQAVLRTDYATRRLARVNEGCRAASAVGAKHQRVAVSEAEPGN